MVVREDQRIRFVGDDEIPPGTEWVYVALDNGDDCLFIKASCVKPEVLSKAWCILGAGRGSTAA